MPLLCLHRCDVLKQLVNVYFHRALPISGGRGAVGLYMLACSELRNLLRQAAKAEADSAFCVGHTRT